MVKLAGHRHVQAMRASVRRKLALQQRQLAKEKEVTQSPVAVQELPAYDPDDNGRFAGYDAIFRCEGNNYEALCRVLKKILRPAHYRTWAAANSDLRNGPPPCLSAKEIAQRVGRHRRTIEIDLQEMRANKLLHIQPARRDGRWVMEMHYDALYRLAYEYLEWEKSGDYIPAERQYFERIELNPDLKQRLLQFDDYRKVLVKQKPGPKSKKKSTHHEAYVCQQRVYVDDLRHKNTCSDAPILPAASQGGMSRSVNLESSVPPALPQAGVSGDICIKPGVENDVPQVCASGSDYQEVSLMHNMSMDDEEQIKDDFELEDGMLIFSSALPSNIVNIRRRRTVGDPFAQQLASNIPYIIDENNILHISASIIPKLRDLLSYLPMGDEFFHNRLAFTPEIQELFDEPAVGVWVYLRDQTEELLFRMEYRPEAGDLELYKTVLAEDVAEAKATRAHRLSKHTKLDKSQKMKNPVNLRDIWTPELEEYVRYGDPNVRYFVPRSDFPPEKQDDFPPNSVGILFCREPATRSLLLYQCSDPSMAGVKAQLEPLARTEAERKRQAYVPHAEEKPAVKSVAFEAPYEEERPPAKSLTPEASYVEERFAVRGVVPSEEERPPAKSLTPEASYVGKKHTVKNIAPEVPHRPSARSVVPENDPVAKPAEQHKEKIYNPARGTYEYRVIPPCNARLVKPKTKSVLVAMTQIVHGVNQDLAYPTILPLLQDFVQTTIIGGDLERRYFIPYMKMASPGIEDAFPPGTDGVWIWRQDEDQTIHIKPTCIAFDPILRNRSNAGSSIVVGRLSDDDGQFYFADASADFIDAEDPLLPEVEEQSNSYVEDSPLPESGEQSNSYVEASPLPEPVEQSNSCHERLHFERAITFSGDGSKKRRAGHAQMPHMVSPPLRLQERYQALLAHAKDGKGKGLQRVFQDYDIGADTD